MNTQHTTPRARRELATMDDVLEQMSMTLPGSKLGIVPFVYLGHTLYIIEGEVYVPTAMELPFRFPSLKEAKDYIDTLVSPQPI